MSRPSPTIRTIKTATPGLPSRGAIYKIALVLGVLTTVGVGLATMSVSTDRMDRLPTSIPNTVDKNSILNFKKAPLLNRTEKLMAPLRVEIEMLPELKEVQKGIPFELSAQITALVALDDVKVEWDLPEGVRMISGDSQIDMSKAKVNSPQMAKVSLVSDVDQNLRIFVHVSANSGTMAFSRSAAFQTREEIQVRNTRKKTLKKITEGLQPDSDDLRH